MIDRLSRDRLALALRRYVSGRVHSDHLDGVAVDGRDRGAVAVKRQAWFLYDDTSRHFAVGRHAVPKAVRREIARWFVFLHSDLEYLWPEHSFGRNLLATVLTFGLWRRYEDRIWQEFCQTGDMSVWPFQSEAELNSVALSPRLLSGGAGAV